MKYLEKFTLLVQEMHAERYTLGDQEKFLLGVLRTALFALKYNLIADMRRIVFDWKIPISFDMMDDALESYKPKDDLEE